MEMNASAPSARKANSALPRRTPATLFDEHSSTCWKEAAPCQLPELERRRLLMPMAARNTVAAIKGHLISPSPV